MTFRKSLCVIILFVCMPFCLLAQSEVENNETILSSEAPSLRFENFSIQDGLTQSSAQDMLQDSLGYLWIATQGGLVKYDGYTFKTYANAPFDSTSLSDNFIYNIGEGSDGDIWVGTTSKGLNRFDRSEQRFRHYRHDPKDSTSISSDQVYDVYQAKNGDVWASTIGGGLNRLPAGSDTTFVHYRHVPGDPNTITSNVLSTISEDGQGNIWVGSVNGLNRINTETNEITRFFYDEGASGARTSLHFIHNQIAQNNKSIIWMGTGKGLVRLNTVTKDYQLFKLPESNSENNSSIVRTVMRDPEDSNILWLGTIDSGLIHFNIRTKKMTPYAPSERDANSIADNTVETIIADRAGNLWFGHDSNGISTANPTSANFKHFKHNPKNSESLAAGNPWGMTRSSDNKLWIATGVGSSRLTSIDLQTGEISHPRKSFSTTIVSLTDAKDGNLWLGAFTGVALFNPRTEETRFYPFSNYKNVEERSTTQYILKDKNDPTQIWVASIGGLSIFDTETRTYKVIPLKDQNRTVSTIATVVYQDQAGQTWVGTTDGLFKVEGSIAKRLLSHNQKDTTSLSNASVMAIQQSPTNPDILWLGTLGGGINRINTHTRTATHYMEKDGLSNNTIYGLLFDSEGTLWASTNSGISNFNPKTETFRNYGLEEGLMNLEYNQNGYFKDKNGRFYFSSVDAVTSFKPEELNINKVLPQVHIDGFRISNKPIKPGPDSPLKEAVEQTEKITLDYSQSELTFEYVGLHFVNPEGNTYKYQLEGFDEDWVDARTKRTATYTNLEPGKYIFKVKAANSDGIWNTRGDQITLTVLPPWYRTWWAYGLFALLVAALATGGIILIKSRVEQKERERSQYREAKLRAEEENKRREDTEQLSKIGRAITSSLSADEIIDTIYQSVNDLMDAAVFGVGIYNEEKERLEFPATKEKGETLPVYAYNLNDENRLSVHCFKNKKEIIIGDYEQEYEKYLNKYLPAVQGDNPSSVIYLPLIQKARVVGVLTTQSFSKNAYSQYHINLLRNLANYASIAIDNAATYRELNAMLEELKNTQNQLVQQEKLASLGQLTAGIAHEIKNPLNFVNNFSELSVELVEEIREELSAFRCQLSGDAKKSPFEGADPDPLSNREESGDVTAVEEALDILDDVEANLRKINEHGTRADGIVKSMLQHSRGGGGEMELTDLNALVKEYVNLSFHGMRASPKSMNVDIDLQLGDDVGEVPLISEDFSRVIVNICNNAFDAMWEKVQLRQGSVDRANGQEEALDDYLPKLTVRTKKKGRRALIEIEDNGPGIPEEIKANIMQPFFTTKKGTDGTGLGLSITNDIIKAHGGELEIESKEKEFTRFKIYNPLN